MLLYGKLKNIYDISNILYKDATVFLNRKYDIYQKVAKLMSSRLDQKSV